IFERAGQRGGTATQASAECHRTVVKPGRRRRHTQRTRQARSGCARCWRRKGPARRQCRCIPRQSARNERRAGRIQSLCCNGYSSGLCAERKKTTDHERRALSLAQTRGDREGDGICSSVGSGRYQWEAWICSRKFFICPTLVKKSGAHGKRICNEKRSICPGALEAASGKQW